MGGKHRMASYATYGEAKAAAGTLVKALAKSSTVAALATKQAADSIQRGIRLRGRAGIQIPLGTVDVLNTVWR